MKVLVHRKYPGAPPAGIWWLARDRSQPKNFYIDTSAYQDGAFAVLGDRWDGQPFRTSEWLHKIEILTNSNSPFYLFSVHDTDRSPQEFLTTEAATAA